jgi:hypothetical protein
MTDNVGMTSSATTPNPCSFVAKSHCAKKIKKNSRYEVNPTSENYQARHPIAAWAKKVFLPLEPKK